METGIPVQALPLWEADLLRQPERFSNPALPVSIRQDDGMVL